MRQQPILDISKKKSKFVGCKIGSMHSQLWSYVYNLGFDTRDDVTCTWKGILKPRSLAVEYFSSGSSLIIIQPYMFSL